MAPGAACRIGNVRNPHLRGLQPAHPCDIIARLTLDTLKERGYRRRKRQPFDRQLGGRSMANSPAYDPSSSRFTHLLGVENGTVCPARARMFLKISLIAMLLLLCLAPRVGGQNAPKITAVAPAAGKVNDNVTL